jgi:hypothetical protein
MKHFLVAVGFLTLFTLSASAQCDPEAVGALYTKFLDNYKGTAQQLQVASVTAKEYLSRFGECPTEPEKKVTAYIKEWQTKYEATLIESKCTNAVDKSPVQAFQECQPYLAKDPENLRAHLLLSLAGIKIASKAENDVKAKAVVAMRKALDLIRNGRTVDQWIFGGSKDEAVGTLEFYSASLTIDTEPLEAAAALLRLAHSNSSYSKDPNTYFYLARSLHDGEVKKQVDEYNKSCSGPSAPADCDLAYKKIESTIDRVIDAYARTVALGSGKSEHERVVALAKPLLTELYKERHENSEAGMDKYVADVLTKPIP